jgi:acyl carrier protein
MRGLEHCLRQGGAQMTYALLEGPALEADICARLRPAPRYPGGPPHSGGGRAAPLTPALRDPGDVQAAVARQAAVVLGMESLAIDPEMPLQTYGMDSLMSVELRDALSSLFGVRLSGTLLFDYPSVSALSGFLAERCLGPGERPAGAAGPAGPAGAAAATSALAIRGMACRYPQCGSPAEYWAFMEAGRAVDAAIPASRRGNFTFYDDRPDVLPAALLEDIAQAPLSPAGMSGLRWGLRLWGWGWRWGGSVWGGASLRREVAQDPGWHPGAQPKAPTGCPMLSR